MNFNVLHALMMKYFKLSLTFVISLISISVQAQVLQKENIGAYSKLKLEVKDSFHIDESEIILPTISVASVNSTKELAVYGKGVSSILLISDRGKRIKKIGRFGRGPFEISNLGYLQLTENAVYAWDKDLLKFTKYSKEGMELTEIQDFRWANKKFRIVNEGYNEEIFFYTSGNISSEFIISRYSINENRFIGQYGKKSQEHILLNLDQGSGGLDFLGGDLFFSLTSSLNIHQNNVYSSETEIYEIKDDEFFVPDIEDARRVIGSGIENLNSILMQSSYVLDIFALESFLVVMAQVGKAKFNSQFNLYTAQDLKFKFYVVDYSTKEVVDIFKFSVAADNKIQDRYWTSNDNQLVLISNSFLSDSENDKESLTNVYFFDISRLVSD